MIKFKNREEAGKELAKKLKIYKNTPLGIVIGLPRGGVIVAAEVAKSLNLPLNIIISKKLSAPFSPELAIGAITQDGKIILDNKIINMYGITDDYIQEEKERKEKEILQRLNLYQKDLPPLALENKTVIIVDDGIATGATVKAVINFVKSKNAKKIIIAVPVAPPEIIDEIKKNVDEVIVLEIPNNFLGIGQFYQDFAQTNDRQVIELLKKQYIQN